MKLKPYGLLHIFIILLDLMVISFAVMILYNIPIKESDIAIDYNSLLGTFIGICTTFVVGFQICNYIYYANKMDALDKEKERLRSKLEELETISLRSMYFNAYTIGRTRFQMAEGYHYTEKDKKYYWNALRGLSNALKYAAKGGHDFDETYKSISHKIYSSIDLIREDDNHLVYDSDYDWIKDVGLDIDSNLEEIKTHIEANRKRKARYHEFIDYYLKWHEFATR